MKRTIFSVMMTVIMPWQLLAGGYRFQKLEEMIARADTIVIARVEAVDPPKIRLHVLELLVGKIPSGPLNIDYGLPPLESSGVRYHYILPGSGLETRLEPGREYVLLLKNHPESVQLLRAEPLNRKANVIEARDQLLLK